MTVLWHCAEGGSGCKSRCWLLPMHCRCVDRHSSNQPASRNATPSLTKHLWKTKYKNTPQNRPPQSPAKTQLFTLTADKPKTFHIWHWSVCRHRLLINGPRSNCKKRNTAVAEAQEDRSMAGGFSSRSIVSPLTDFIFYLSPRSVLATEVSSVKMEEVKNE